MGCTEWVELNQKNKPQSNAIATGAWHQDNVLGLINVCLSSSSQINAPPLTGWWLVVMMIVVHTARCNGCAIECMCVCVAQGAETYQHQTTVLMCVL